MAGAEGSILVWALVFAVLSTAMIVSHSAYMAANRTEMRVQNEYTALGDNFARSGLTDALGWFQRQPTQPVLEFSPRYDPDGDPPLFDTIDPTVGLVQEFEVRGNLWGRYEVRAGEMTDISAERGAETGGMIWDVGARGFLYHLVDPERAFDQAPNRVVASSYVRTEMRGIALVPPAHAAVVIDDSANLDIGPRASIVGGEVPGVAHRQRRDRRSMMAHAPPGVAGTPASLSMVQFEMEPSAVFSMNMSTLKSMSDFVIDPEAPGLGGVSPSLAMGSRPMMRPVKEGRRKGKRGRTVRGRPSSIRGRTRAGEGARENRRASFFGRLASWFRGARGKRGWAWGWEKRRFAAGRGQRIEEEKKRELKNETVFCPGALVLSQKNPFKGRALLIVDGDLEVERGSDASLKGLIYVTGDVNIDGDFTLDGMMIVRGKLRMGYGDGEVVIRYDPATLASLKKSVERYRMSRSVRPGWSGGGLVAAPLGGSGGR